MCQDGTRFGREFRRSVSCATQVTYPRRARPGDGWSLVKLLPERLVVVSSPAVVLAEDLLGRPWHTAPGVPGERESTTPGLLWFSENRENVQSLDFRFLENRESVQSLDFRFSEN